MTVFVMDTVDCICDGHVTFTRVCDCSHDKALEGITVCGEIRGQERFVPIIMGMGMRDNPAMQVSSPCHHDAVDDSISSCHCY